MLSPITQKQFERLKQRYPDAVLTALPSGAGLVTIPAVSLPEGWSRATSSVRFVVPIGYPGPAPDCFWADQELRLANGQQPQASQVNQIPEANQQALWFSWHVVEAAKNWNPNRDDLLTFVGIIMDRFRRPQ
ncbi:MAG: E2/UBC family protein [Bauldia sp.]